MTRTIAITVDASIPIAQKEAVVCSHEPFFM